MVGRQWIGGALVNERRSEVWMQLATLHRPGVEVLVTVSDGGVWRDIEPDTFEEIVARRLVCPTCGVEAPCATQLLLAQLE
jgi:hypothetical protein